jgi:hypothetical protein
MVPVTYSTQRRTRPRNPDYCQLTQRASGSYPYSGQSHGSQPKGGKRRRARLILRHEGSRLRRMLRVLMRGDRLLDPAHVHKAMSRFRNAAAAR